GWLLRHGRIESDAVGQAWGKDANLQKQQANVDGRVQYFVTSPYMDVLKQYKVGAGTFTGHDVVTQNSPSGTTLDDSQIRTLLNAEISAQHVPGPTADRLYVFFTAPGTVVTVNGKTSGANFLGYHSQFTNSAGASITYAVI